MYLIFTDLDGTLLDFETYSFEKASEILDLIRKQKIPLVAVTSKTAAEVREIIRALDLSHPFITENGGGVFFPHDYPGDFPRTQLEDGYYAVPFVHPEIKHAEVLGRISEETGVPLKGFSNMTVEDVISLTGLSHEEAGKAKQRHFSEPFVIPPLRSDMEKIIRFSASYKYKVVEGGRFAHLIPVDSGKDNAVRFLIAFYQKLFPGQTLRSIGLGDSPNDFPFLAVTDISILIRNRGKIQNGGSKKWIRSEKYGVEGWAGELKKIISV